MVVAMMIEISHFVSCLNVISVALPLRDIQLLHFCTEHFSSDTGCGHSCLFIILISYWDCCVSPVILEPWLKCIKYL